MLLYPGIVALLLTGLWIATDTSWSPLYRAVLIDRKSKAKNIMLNARTGGTASLKASTFSRAGKKESATDEAKKIINKLFAK